MGDDLLELKAGKEWGIDPERMSQLHPATRAKMIAFMLHDNERGAYEMERGRKKAEKEAKEGKKKGGLNEYERMMLNLNH